MLSISQLQIACDERSEESFHPIDDWSPTDYACCLGEEVGEVLGKIKRIRRLDDGADKPYNHNVDKAELTIEIGKELADVIIYCCLLASRIELDLEGAVKLKFNEVSDRVGSERKLI